MGQVVRLQGRTVPEMMLLVDTGVWSLAFRRDQDSGAPQVSALRDALEGDEIVVTTGLVLQELLQGFAGPRAQGHHRAFGRPAPPRPGPARCIDAAQLRNSCRRAGVQVGTIDALLALFRRADRAERASAVHHARRGVVAWDVVGPEQVVPAMHAVWSRCPLIAVFLALICCCVRPVAAKNRRIAPQALTKQLFYEMIRMKLLFHSPLPHEH